MAAHRVQGYLEKHKIGPLFESLMARVIQDTPDDPVAYIIKILQGIHKKQKGTDAGDFNLSVSRSSSRKSILRSSQNELNGIKPRSNNLAASWSAGEPQHGTNSGDKYPRPWTSNSKSTANKTWSSNENTRLTTGEESQPVWNNDTRVPTHDFDELFQIEHGDQQTSQKPSKEKYRGVKSWDVQDKVTHEKSLQSRDSQLSNDDLHGELKLGEYQKSKSSRHQAGEVVPMTSSRSRPVKARRAVEEHRHQLQALLLEDNGGGTKEVKSLRHSPEEGMDILESPEDLQEEGVETVAKKGAKLNKIQRGKTDGNVSVTICARCARIIGGQADMDSSSQVASSFSDFNASPFDDVTNKKDDDFLDNFDTASEASVKMNSSRRNMWPMASDSESEITPRDSTVTFKQRIKSPSQKEAKGMYSRRNIASPEPSSRPSSSRSNVKVPDGFLNSQRGKSWGMNGHSSDNETEVEAVRPSTPSSMNGRPWDIPSDNYSDDENRSSHRGNTGFPRVERYNQRSRNLASDVASSVAESDY